MYAYVLCFICACLLPADCMYQLDVSVFSICGGFCNQTVHFAQNWHEACIYCPPTVRKTFSAPQITE